MSADNCDPSVIQIVIGGVEHIHDVPILCEKSQKKSLISKACITTTDKVDELSVAPYLRRCDIHPSRFASAEAFLHFPKDTPAPPASFGLANCDTCSSRLTAIGHGRFDGLIPIAIAGAILVGHGCNAPLYYQAASRQNANAQMPRSRGREVKNSCFAVSFYGRRRTDAKKSKSKRECFSCESSMSCATGICAPGRPFCCEQDHPSFTTRINRPK